MKYVYTDITTVKNSGVSGLTDSQIYELITVASNYVNSLTSQWFIPVSGVFSFNSGGSKMIYHNTLVPILDVNNLSIEFTRSYRDTDFSTIDLVNEQLALGNTIVSYPSETYEVSENRRYIALLSTTSNFSRGVRNVWVDGTLGWMDGVGQGWGKKVVATTQSQLVVGSTSLTLDTVSGDYGSIDVGDVIAVKVESSSGIIEDLKISPYIEESLYLIVRSVDQSTNVVTFDPIQELPLGVSSIGIGAPILCFGAIPKQISRVTVWFVKQLIKEGYVTVDGSSIGADDVSASQDPELRNRLIEERVVDYVYRLQPRDSTQSGLGTISGNIMIDSIIQEFSAPPLMVGV